MFAAVVAALCLTALATPAQAGTPFLKPRERHGRLYSEHVARKEAARLAAGLPAPNTTANWFNQRIYQWDPAALSTFKQRYFVDWTGWQQSSNTSGRIAMMYIPGEGPCENSIDGFGQQMAYQFNAVAVSLENRWYGESMVGSLTDTQLLRDTLNVAVALEDLAVFMRWFRTQYLPPDTKWLVVGGSYSGALSAWMRQTYPDLVHASWSSSGVVHPTFDFNEYYGHVQNILDEDCANAVQEAATEFNLIYENEAARPALYQMLNIPADTPYSFSKQDLQANLVSGIGGSVQYGFRSTHCNGVLAARSAGTDALQAYADVTMDLWGSNYFSNCGASTECLTNVKFADQWANAGVSWLFQTCIEMAFWQIGFPDSLMPVDVSSDYYMQQCRAAFGNATFPDVVSFNAFHGGLSVNGTTYVVAAQGSDDPWSTVGVRASLGPLYPARVAECADCGHCGDLFSPTASTPASKIAQQQFINATLTAWFQQ